MGDPTPWGRAGVSSPPALSSSLAGPARLCLTLRSLSCCVSGAKVLGGSLPHPECLSHTWLHPRLCSLLSGSLWTPALSSSASSSLCLLCLWFVVWALRTHFPLPSPAGGTISPTSLCPAWPWPAHLGHECMSLRCPPSTPTTHAGLLGTCAYPGQAFN